MTRLEIDAKFEQELAHIPTEPRDHQGDLRMLYNANRRRNLGKTAGAPRTASQVITRCAEAVSERYPGEELYYDTPFFDARSD